MHTAEDQNLKLIETELRFISRHACNLLTDDHESVHEIGLAVESALRALTEYKLGLEPACEEVPPGPTMRPDE
jgi:hypothetical protein